MGQFISLIVTKEIPEKIPEELVHFIQNEYLIIPLSLLHLNREISDLIKYNELSEWLDSKNHESEVFSIVQSLRLRTFVLSHYSEHGDMPIDVIDFIVKDGQIMKETINLIDTNGDYYTETMLGYFTEESTYDITPYWNYKSCVAIYAHHQKGSL